MNAHMSLNAAIRAQVAREFAPALENAMDPNADRVGDWLYATVQVIKRMDLRVQQLHYDAATRLVASVE